MARGRPWGQGAALPAAPAGRIPLREAATHIILSLLGVIGAAAFFIWRINLAARAAREVADTAGELANLPRKMKFRHRAGKRGVDLVDDPREAAAALVYGAALSKGDPGEEDRAMMTARLAELFEICEADCGEVLARGAWRIRALNDPLNAVSALTDRLVREVGCEACARLLAVMTETAETVQGPGSEAARYYTSKFADRAGLR